MTHFQYRTPSSRINVRRGFTLIEVLVVVAIIALLAAILFPVFARAREQARRSSCASNLKQLGLAIAQYTQDYDERLPLYSYGNGHLGSSGYATGDGARWADIIFPYTKSTQIFDCPSGNNKMTLFGQSYDILTYSYGYATPTAADSLFGVAGRHMSEIQDAAGTIMMVDDGRSEDGTGNEGMGRVIPNAADTLDTLSGKVNGVRHTGAAQNELTSHGFNAAYADGHVKWVRLTDTFPAQWTVTTD